ncbi:MAG TPA: GNAT family N-acetyltransferase [Bacteroidales bacterium]|nr:GNAT family N-acetyltransferase [Bacteroidales bacterium]
MDNDVIIRRAEAKDLNEIYYLVCELENEQLDYDKFGRIYNENVKNPEYAYFIVLADDEVIGFISLHTQNLLHHCGRVGEIQEFIIHKKFRNAGIGKKLMAEIDKFSLNNITDLEVTSNKKRTENVKIYEKLGFKLTHNKFTRKL